MASRFGRLLARIRGAGTSRSGILSGLDELSQVPPWMDVYTFRTPEEVAQYMTTTDAIFGGAFSPRTGAHKGGVHNGGVHMGLCDAN